MSVKGIEFCLACPGSQVRAGVIAVEGVGLCCAPCAKRIEETGIRPEIPEGPGLPHYGDPWGDPAPARREGAA